MAKYSLEFVLHSPHAQAEAIRNTIVEFGENLKITECPESTLKVKSYKICVLTEDPTIIFDLCVQFGSIKSVKADEGC